MAEDVTSIYLGNLPVTASEDDVRELCSPHGEVVGVTLILDHETGQFRGFGYVKMDPEGATRAIDALDGAEYDGRTLRANEARDRGARPPRRAW